MARYYYVGLSWPSVMHRSRLPAIDTVVKRRALPVTLGALEAGGEKPPPPEPIPEPAKEPEPEPA